MKYSKLTSPIFLLVLLSCVSVPPEPAPPQNRLFSLAENDGAKLYAAFEAGVSSVNSAEFAEAKALVTNFCGFPYSAVSVPENNGAKYFIGQDPKNRLVFGRHFRVSGSQVKASTKSCFVAPNPPAGAKVAGAFTTHLLSDTPSEFHVFLSLVHGQPIFVGTQSGRFVIENGKISVMRN